MRQIGHIVGREDFGLFTPEDGDRVVLADDGGGLTLSVYSDGRLSHRTDKVNYQSLGGVAFFGSVDKMTKRGPKSGVAAFVPDPRWGAANILAVRQLGKKGVNVVELHPVSNLSEAVRVIQRKVRGYQWMPAYEAWGVPRYEFGPERWVLFPQPASLG